MGEVFGTLTALDAAQLTVGFAVFGLIAGGWIGILTSTAIADRLSPQSKYGNRNVPKMIAQVEALRRAIRAEGTPAIQDAWDKVEEHIDYAYRREGRDG